MRTDAELNRIIAEWAGWKPTSEDIEASNAWRFTAGELIPPRPPNYCTDLNAIANTEHKLSHLQRTDYIRILNQGDFSYRRLAFATARRRGGSLGEGDRGG